MKKNKILALALLSGTVAFAQSSSNDPVITAVLGSGLYPHFDTTDTQLESAARDLAAAGFGYSWDVSPRKWAPGCVLDDEEYFAYFKKTSAVLRKHGIGIHLGCHWHKLLPDDAGNMRGEKLDPDTGRFEKDNWNYGYQPALALFKEQSKKLFQRIGWIEMFYADEVVFGKAGQVHGGAKISTYWTSPTYSRESLHSFRKYLEQKGFPGALSARFPVTTVAVESGVDANKGLPAVPLHSANKDRLVEDNDWPNSSLWKLWYEWREDLYCEWLAAVTAIAWEMNRENPNWLGCYYEMPVQWMETGLAQNIGKIIRLPHIDYMIAGYTSGHRYAPVKELADSVGKKWGLQIELSRYRRDTGMPLDYIENTFTNAVKDGASLITCYAGTSFRTDLPRETVSDLRKKHTWHYLPEQAAVWKNCIQWLEDYRGIRRPDLDEHGAAKEKEG